ncbi:hypothetical protein [Aliiglaciecola aliphaticivorans]
MHGPPVVGGFSPEKTILKIMIIHGRPYLSWPKDHATGLEEKTMHGHPVVGGFSPERAHGLKTMLQGPRKNPCAVTL